MARSSTGKICAVNRSIIALEICVAMASWMKEEQKRGEVAVESKVTTKRHKSAVTIWCILLRTDTGRILFYFIQ